MEKFIDQCENFPFELIRWYEANHRKLPWRETKDPYKIWLSEIILQQTRVIQGINYYRKFTEKYPLVSDLAEASEEEILKDWQGLGYYSRARNLHYTANSIVEDHGGIFPSDYNDIRKLKGIGDYTAAAIASFAYNLNYAVVDGNVYRLLSRYFGIKTPIDSAAGKKEFAGLAQKLIPKNKAAIYNQAIMEFGALQCTPANPDCTNCPLQAKCIAYANNSIAELPVKEKKTKVRNRYFHYFILQKGEEILINKREGKGIWQNLFDFPLLESTASLTWNEIQEEDQFNNLIDHKKVHLSGESDVRLHLLSHQRLHCKFFHLDLEKFSDSALEKYKLTSLKELPSFPIPKLIENYLREETNLLSLFGN